MNELIVLSVNEDKIVDTVKVPEKQKRIRALNDWIKAHGEDGGLYRMAKFVTPPVRAEETKMMLPIALPEPKAEKKAKEEAKKEAVEA